MTVKVLKGAQVRCDDYCPAAPFCNQYKELNDDTEKL